jgi:hypothetical protein
MRERVVQGYKRVLGAEHISTLNAIHFYGSFYAKQGKTETIYQRINVSL